MGEKTITVRKLLGFLAPHPIRIARTIAVLAKLVYLNLAQALKNGAARAIQIAGEGNKVLKSGHVPQKMDYFYVVFGQGRWIFLAPVIVSVYWDTDWFGIFRTFALAMPILMLILFTFIINRRVNS